MILPLWFAKKIGFHFAVTTSAMLLNVAATLELGADAATLDNLSSILLKLKSIGILPKNGIPTSSAYKRPPSLENMLVHSWMNMLTH